MATISTTLGIFAPAEITPKKLPRPGKIIAYDHRASKMLQTNTTHKPYLLKICNQCN